MPKRQIPILVDTKEKRDFFTFKSYGDVSTTWAGLETGDYTIKGYENKITIDRKETSNELYICFAKDWKRFEKELIRMSYFDEAYIVCSFPEYFLDIYPVNSNLPKYLWSKVKINPKFLRKKYLEIENTYPNIKFKFGNTNIEAEDITYNILKDYYVRTKNKTRR